MPLWNVAQTYVDQLEEALKNAQEQVKELTKKVNELSRQESDLESK